MDVVCSAPGKIILFGEHSVVHGRPAVAASAGGALRCYARVRATPAAGGAPRLTLRLDSFGVSLSWGLLELRGQLRPAATVDNDGAARAALDAAAAAAVAHLEDGETVREAAMAFLFLFGSIWQQGGASTAAEEGDVLVHVWSTLPVGAGMGSSASYSVALAAALLHAAADTGAAAEAAPAPAPAADGEVASAALRNAANDWAFECERLFHGAPSGIDNTVCSNGGAVLFTVGSDPQPLDIPAGSRLRILVTNTKVPGRSTKRMVAAVNDLVTGPLGETVGEPLLDAMGSLAVQAADVLTSADQSAAEGQLAELIRINHHLLNAIGVGHSQCDRVVQLSAEHGFAAKITGGGGGGCVITLLSSDDDEGVGPEAGGATSTEKGKENALVDALTAGGFECFEAMVGDEGVKLHPSPPAEAGAGEERPRM